MAMLPCWERSFSYCGHVHDDGMPAENVTRSVAGFTGCMTG